MSDDKTNNRMRDAPPQLTFDDGSRAVLVTGEKDEITSPRHSNLRQSSTQFMSIQEYYEIDRIVAQIQHYQRIALQFPDNLLGDAPEVCWALEERLPHALIFCLGDTTYASCCPDVVAAAHLQADCLIHYGHACLSATTSQIPVLHSFGQLEMDTVICAAQLLNQMKDEMGSNRSLLLFYELHYAHAMVELAHRLSNTLHVTLAQVPETTTIVSQSESDPKHDIHDNEEQLHLGGLKIPALPDLSDHVLLYVGSESSRQYLNIVLRFLSTSARPRAFWTYDPSQQVLSTSLSPSFQRQLNRRFYLLQKAKLCSVFGILVAQLSNPTLRTIVNKLQNIITDHGRSSYTFAVGKVNPAKLANFAEVECFVLVACPEHSLLDEEREYPTSVITPMELCMALGVSDWGSTPYSLDAKDFLCLECTTTSAHNKEDDSNSETSDDAPHYNLTTGQYESVPKRASPDIDLSLLPGQGKLMEYQSAAADFLHSREYQGLQVKAGETSVQRAQKGQQGIASNYGNR
jgi:diphthamide biosynthesis protein 2